MPGRGGVAAGTRAGGTAGGASKKPSRGKKPPNLDVAKQLFEFSEEVRTAIDKHDVEYFQIKRPEMNRLFKNLREPTTKFPIDSIGRTLIHWISGLKNDDTTGGMLAMNLIKNHSSLAHVSHFAQLDASGRSPLHIAVTLTHSHTVEPLLERLRLGGEEILSWKTEDAHGMAPVHYAVRGSLSCGVSCCLSSAGKAQATSARAGQSVPSERRQDSWIIKYLLEHTHSIDLLGTEDRHGRTGLHHATDSRVCDPSRLVQELLEKPLQPLLQDSHGQTPFMLILQFCDTQTVVKMFGKTQIDRQYDKALNQIDHNYWSPLHFAVSNSSGLDLENQPLRNFLRQQIEAWRSNKRAETPLHCACRFGCLKTLEWLYQYDRLLVDEWWNRRDQSGRTAAHCCALNPNSRWEMLSWINNNAELVSKMLQEDNDKLTPLHLAVLTWQNKLPNYEEQFRSMKQLIDVLDVNHFSIADSHGKTVVHYAAGNPACTKLLPRLKEKLPEERFLDVDHHGVMPLHLMAERQTCKGYMRLISTHLNIKDLKGRSLAHYLAMSSHPEKIVKFIRQQTAETAQKKLFFSEFRQPDADGRTPLHYAAINRSFTSSALPLPNKATDNSANASRDIETKSLFWWLIVHHSQDCAKAFSAKDFQSRTPFHYAAQFQHTWIPEMGMSKVTPEVWSARDAKNRTPIHLAAKHQSHLSFLRSFQDKSLLERKDVKGRTPAHLAAKNKFGDTLTSLIECCGSRILSEMDADGITPLHFAMKWQTLEKALKALSASGIKTLMKDREGKTPLHFAACGPHTLEFVRHYIDNGKMAELTAEADNFGRTVMHHLCANRTGFLAAEHFVRHLNTNDPKSSELLFAGDSQGTTAIHLMARNHRKETLKTTLDFCCSEGKESDWVSILGKKNCFESTPVHELAKNMYCRQNMPDEFMRMLKENLCVKDVRGMTPVHLFCSNRLRQSTVETLFREHTEAFGKQDELGCTPLHYAFQHQDHQFIKKSLKKLWPQGEQPSEILLQRDKKGRTALHIAAMHQNSVALSHLCHSELNWNGADQEGMTPMHYVAANSRAVGIMPDLIERRNMDVNSSVLKMAARNSGVHEFFELMYQKIPVGSKRSALSEFTLELAGNGQASSAMLQLLKNNREDFLSEEDRIQLASQVSAFQKQSVVEQAVRTLKKKFFLKETKSGKSAMQRCAKREFFVEILTQVRNEEGPPIDMRASNTGKSISLVAAKYQAASGKQKMESSGGLNFSGTDKDSLGRTVLHYGAMNRRDSSMLATLLGENPNFDALLETCKRKRSVLHYVAMNKVTGGRNLKWLFKRLQRNGSENNVLKSMIQSLLSGDLDGITPLHFALQHQNSRCIQSLLKLLKMDSNNERLLSGLSQTDHQHRSSLHFSARNSKYGFDVTDVIRQEIQDNNFKCLAAKRDLQFRNSTFFAFGSKNVRLMQEVSDEQRRILRDRTGNTLLHALFLWDKNDSEQLYCTAKEIVREVLQLIKTGVDPCTENSADQNFFQAAELPMINLRQVIDIFLHFGEKSMVQKLLYNTSRVHAINYFFSRYPYIEIKELMCSVSDRSWYDLLLSPVDFGPKQGGTVMHFTCEGGHEQNIRYLLEEKFSMADETNDGLNSYDFACRAGHQRTLDRIMESFQPDVFESVVDPGRRGVQLPTQQEAAQMLDSFSSPRQQLEKRENADFHLANLDYNQWTRPEVSLLLEAIRLDSIDHFRALMTLGFKVTPTVEAEVFALLLQADGLSNIGSLEEAFRGKQKPDFIEIVLHLRRVQVLFDFVVTRQSDLIPVCLRVLIEIQALKTSYEAKDTHLRSLEYRVKCVLINAFEHVYADARDEERNIIFDFMASERKFCYFKPSLNYSGIFRCIGGCSSKERTQWERSEATIKQMIELYDCEEVYATCLLVDFVDEELKRFNCECHQSEPSTGADNPAAGRRYRCFTSLNVKAKIVVHSLAYIFFLTSFAAWIIDIRRNFHWHVPEYIFWWYLISLLLQEVFDMVMLKINYLRDVFNVFDILAIVAMLVGLIWKRIIAEGSEIGEKEEIVYGCQITLTVSFVLWCFRAFCLLRYFRSIGPLISMFHDLIWHNLLPFLAIMLVMYVMFGVFVFNIVFPGTSIRSDDSQYVEVRNFGRIFTIPLHLTAGFFEKVEYETCSSYTASATDCANSGGQNFFLNVVLFIFFLVIGVVMLNLLIALFNVTVTRMATRPLAIWRRSRYQLLQEFANKTWFAPPFTIFGAFNAILVYSQRYKHYQLSQRNTSESKPAELPEEFARLHAKTMRRHRHQLWRPPILSLLDSAEEQAEASTVASNGDHGERPKWRTGSDPTAVQPEQVRESWVRESSILQNPDDVRQTESIKALLQVQTQEILAGHARLAGQFLTTNNEWINHVSKALADVASTCENTKREIDEIKETLGNVYHSITNAQYMPQARIFDESSQSNDDETSSDDLETSTDGESTSAKENIEPNSDASVTADGSSIE